MIKKSKSIIIKLALLLLFSFSIVPAIFSSKNLNNYDNNIVPEVSEIVQTNNPPTGSSIPMIKVHEFSFTDFSARVKIEVNILHAPGYTFWIHQWENGQWREIVRSDSSDWNWTGDGTTISETFTVIPDAEYSLFVAEHGVFPGEFLSPPVNEKSSNDSIIKSSGDNDTYVRIIRKSEKQTSFNIEDINLTENAYDIDWSFESHDSYLNMKNIKVYGVRNVLYTPAPEDKCYDDLFNIEGEFSSGEFSCIVGDAEFKRNVKDEMFGNISGQMDSRYEYLYLIAEYGHLGNTWTKTISKEDFVTNPTLKFLNSSFRNETHDSAKVSFSLYDPNLIISSLFGNPEEKFYININDHGDDDNFLPNPPTTDMDELIEIKDPDEERPDDKEYFAYWIDKYEPPYDDSSNENDPLFGIGTGTFLIGNLDPGTNYSIDIFATSKRYPKASVSLMERISIKTLEFPFDFNVTKFKHLFLEDEGETKYSFEIDMFSKSNQINTNINLDSFEIYVYKLESEVDVSNIIFHSPLVFKPFGSSVENNLYKFVATGNSNYDASFFGTNTIVIEGKDFEGNKIEIKNLFNLDNMKEDLGDKDIEFDSVISKTPDNFLVFNDRLKYNKNLYYFSDFKYSIYEKISGSIIIKEPSSSSDYSRINNIDLRDDFVTINLETKIPFLEFNFPPDQIEFEFLTNIDFKFASKENNWIIEDESSTIIFDEDDIVEQEVKKELGSNYLIPILIITTFFAPVFIWSIFKLYKSSKK